MISVRFQVISVRFQVKSFTITGIRVYAQSLTPKKLKLNGSIKIYKTSRIITKKKKKNVGSGRLGPAGPGGGGPAVSLEHRAAGPRRWKVEELGKKYCVYCLAEVSPLRFRCTKCQDIEPCPECFSAAPPPPPPLPRIPAGARRALHALGARGRGRLKQPRGAAAAGCHRAVRLWELGGHGNSRRRFPDSPGSDGALHISVAEQ